VLAGLASLRHPPGSDGERQAAEIVAGEFEARGARAWIEHERAHGTYSVPIGLARGLGALASSRGRVGAALGGLLAAASVVTIAFSPAVPRANDNLSSVAALLPLVEGLCSAPPRAVRVMLVSTGSEESFLEVMVRFGERWFQSLPRETTTFLCLESIGSPRLMLLSGEGLLRLYRYPEELIDALSELAGELGVPLRDPFRYRLAIGGQGSLRAGYPAAAISWMDWFKAPSSYHWPSDRPENLCYESVEGATALALAYVRRLDGVVGGNAVAPAGSPR
jgi:hypothetical protein